jgi:Spy/CpxP family protein refolding chaperone
MMWKRTKWYLIVVSVALNVAFVAMWIAHGATRGGIPHEADPQATQHTIWCPLHRELGVTDGQWQQIEPRLREFQAAVGDLRHEVDARRLEVIDLVAAEEPDGESIRAKQDEILATKRKIQDLVAEHLVAEKQVLTPSQQQRLFGLLRERACCGDGPHLAGPPRGDDRPATGTADGDSR